MSPASLSLVARDGIIAAEPARRRAPEPPLAPPLAVATQDPASVAETYVRQHMQRISPGRTVGICFAGEPTVSIPYFDATRLPANRWAGKLDSLSALLRTGHAGALPAGAESRLATFLRWHGVTTILAEFGPTGCALRRFCTTHGIRLFVNFHGFDATVMPKRRSILLAYRRLARDADGLICGSRHFRDVLTGLGLPADRISIIPCGVVPEHFTPSPHRDPDLVLGVGRLTAKKAPHLAIEAFALARRARPALRLELVGDGPMRQACEDTIRRLDLTGCVRLHGACDHGFVRDRMAHASLFVQHSVTAPNGDQESQGISLLEAMAASLPVVATDHNGFSETVVHGKTGLLSAEGDVDAMARNIADLMAFPATRQRMGEAGRTRVLQGFTADGAAEALRRLMFAGEGAAR